MSGVEGLKPGLLTSRMLPRLKVGSSLLIGRMGWWPYQDCGPFVFTGLKHDLVTVDDHPDESFFADRFDYVGERRVVTPAALQPSASEPTEQADGGVVAPEPPWPIGSDNPKREGWKAFFAGRGREDCPFPAGSPYHQVTYREGWDAAKQSTPPATPIAAARLPLDTRGEG
jgi:hypothetical protein